VLKKFSTIMEEAETASDGSKPSPPASADGEEASGAGSESPQEIQSEPPLVNGDSNHTKATPSSTT
jgi:hypothetical protein